MLRDILYFVFVFVVHNDGHFCIQKKKVLVLHQIIQSLVTVIIYLSLSSLHILGPQESLFNQNSKERRGGTLDETRQIDNKLVDVSSLMVSIFHFCPYLLISSSSFPHTSLFPLQRHNQIPSSVLVPVNCDSK